MFFTFAFVSLYDMIIYKYLLNIISLKCELRESPIEKASLVDLQLAKYQPAQIAVFTHLVILEIFCNLCLHSLRIESLCSRLS